MYKAQRIRDPIHNLISFKADEFDNTMWDVIQTEPFQRLRRIKQLGFSEFVYPGASHTRFAHSLGVFNTARQLMEIIRRHVGPDGYQTSSAGAALAAALVHDVGHGPFSHAFEAVGENLELKLANHETVSQQLIRDSEISDCLKALGSGFHNDVADVIESEAPRSVYDAVVSSQFDADRLDYLRRDRTMCGSAHGVIDYEWLLSNLEIGRVSVGVDDQKTGEIDTFVIGPKAIFAAESYVIGLFQLYPTIYLHKTTRGADKLFSELLTRLFKYIIDSGYSGTGLPSSHPLVRFALEPENVDNVLQLDDAVVTGSLHLMRESTDEVISEFSERLVKRKLFKCFDVREEVKRRLISAFDAHDDVSSDFGSKPDIEDQTDRIVAKIVEKAAPTMKGKANVLFDTYSRSSYRRFDESKGPLNQIRVQRSDGSSVDLEEYSPVVRSIRPYRLARYYFSDQASDERNTLMSIVDGEVHHAN